MIDNTSWWMDHGLVWVTKRKEQSESSNIHDRRKSQDCVCVGLNGIIDAPHCVIFQVSHDN